MGEAGELSPIDPTVGNLLNPRDEVTKQPVGISVEDVTSYMELARDTEKVGLKADEHILEVFKELSSKVHPVALGNVNRAHLQIRRLARKLLATHLDEDTNEELIETIVQYLTTQLYSHTHAIGRAETRDLLGADMAPVATDEEQSLMWGLYEDYADLLSLGQTLCKDSFFVDETQMTEIAINGAFIETEFRSLIYQAQVLLTIHSRIPPGVQVQLPHGQDMPLIKGLPKDIHVEVLSMGWQENKEGV